MALDVPGEVPQSAPPVSEASRNGIMLFSSTSDSPRADAALRASIAHSWRISCWWC
ncbi:hypothetical protein [Nannocystis pusilla]|uniref:hypothetical protein n=1 Tax=Nannocystis pusilla TaxID=889268 RepID=UPI003B7F4F85